LKGSEKDKARRKEEKVGKEIMLSLVGNVDKFHPYNKRF
jgi:hypothetical protein